MELSIPVIIYTFIYIVLCKMFVETFARKMENRSVCIIYTFLMALTVFDCFASSILLNNFIAKQMVIVMSRTIIIWLGCVE